MLKTRRCSVLDDAVLATASRTPAAARHASESMSRAEPGGEDAREVAGNPAARDVRERAHVRVRAQRPHVVEVEAVRLQEQVSPSKSSSPRSRRTSVKPFVCRPADGKPRIDVALLDARAVDERSRARRSRRTCRRSRAPPPCRPRAARPSRRRSGRSRRRGRPRRLPRRAPRPARGRSRSPRRSRGRTSARRRS